MLLTVLYGVEKSTPAATEMSYILMNAAVELAPAVCALQSRSGVEQIEMIKSLEEDGDRDWQRSRAPINPLPSARKLAAPASRMARDHGLDRVARAAASDTPTHVTPEPTCRHTKCLHEALVPGRGWSVLQRLFAGETNSIEVVRQMGIYEVGRGARHRIVEARRRLRRGRRQWMRREGARVLRWCGQSASS